MFDKQNIEIMEKVEARKMQITDENAWELLKNAREIIVGRGKKSQNFTPSAKSKAEILSNCLGRTGNLRAPTLRIGDRYIVGFNEDMYSKYVKG